MNSENMKIFKFEIIEFPKLKIQYKNWNWKIDEYKNRSLNFQL